ncbi:MAG: hypothetical protein KTR25_15345 [Myxococcales bacterium]|nr:hypothetical protein [Myxococcales bacterium]
MTLLMGRCRPERYDCEVLDLHNHVLFGLDDGCRNPEESKALALSMAAAGHIGVVATPHIRWGIFNNTPDQLRARWRATHALVTGVGLEFYLGAEYYFDAHLLAEAKAQSLLTLGEKSRYVLIEFPKDQLPLRWQDVLFELRLRDYVAVIAHPERCGSMRVNMDQHLEDLRRAGVLLQLDLGSLIGTYGRGPQKLAEQLVRRDAYHVAAGDLHRPEDVASVLEPARRAFAKVFRKYDTAAAWDRLCVENPQAILRNEAPEEIKTIASSQ